MKGRSHFRRRTRPGSYWRKIVGSGEVLLGALSSGFDAKGLVSLLCRHQNHGEGALTSLMPVCISGHRRHQSYVPPVTWIDSK